MLLISKKRNPKYAIDTSLRSFCISFPKISNLAPALSLNLRDFEAEFWKFVNSASNFRGD